MPDSNDNNSSDPLSRAVVLRPGSGSAELDLSKLSDEDRNEIVKAYNQGMVDVHTRAASLGVDIQALGATLRELSDTTEKLAESKDTAVTITHTQDSSAGRTEIIIGNTDTAHRGRLSRSQTGERDLTKFYIIGGAAVLAIILLAVLLR